MSLESIQTEWDELSNEFAALEVSEIEIVIIIIQWNNLKISISINSIGYEQWICRVTGQIGEITTKVYKRYFTSAISY